MHRLMFFICFGVLLQGCTSLTISRPFKVVDNEVVGDKDELWVVLTYAEINANVKNKNSFSKHVGNIYRDLDKQEGLYGYSLRREIFGNKAWTMTVWKDKQSITRFKFSRFHALAIADAPKIIEQAAFHSFQVSKSELPIDWSNALDKLQNSSRSYDFSSQDYLN